MNTILLDTNSDLSEIETIAKAAFSSTPDSSLEDWFSCPYMKKMIQEGRGFCLKAISDEDKITGCIYAQQENPINGKEGEDKWVIIIAAVDPNFTGKGVGSLLLKDLEALARSKKVSKIFTFTNKDDERVINFYRKNGYEDAGWIKDYQYGKNNSAVFLLKHLDE